MKRINVFMVIATIGMTVVSCGNGFNANVKMSSDVDSFLYAVGAANGMAFREQLQTVPGVEDRENLDVLISGFAHGAQNNASKIQMTQEEAQTFIQDFLTQAQTKQFESIKIEGEAFLVSNGGQAGVITTESGMQYKVITEGTGKMPTREDRVIVHYTGKLLDGTIFDSSVQSGEPATFGVTQVIRGWTEVLLLMPVGSKYQVWIPYELAYGEQGSGPIPPFSTLDFEIELLGIEE